MKSIDIEELKRLYYDEEKSGYKIAEHFQTVPQVIYNRMEEHGLQRRTASRCTETTVRRKKEKAQYQRDRASVFWGGAEPYRSW